MGSVGLLGFLLYLSFVIHLYNNPTKIFGAEGVLRRRLEILEGEMVYTIRRNICITRLPAWVYFFEKKFSRAEDCAEGYVRNPTLVQ